MFNQLRNIISLLHNIKKENPLKTNKLIRFWGKYLFAGKVFVKEKCNKYHGIYIFKIDMIDPNVLLCQYNTEDILLTQ